MRRWRASINLTGTYFFPASPDATRRIARGLRIIALMREAVRYSGRRTGRSSLDLHCHMVEDMRTQADGKLRKILFPNLTNGCR